MKNRLNWYATTGIIVFLWSPCLRAQTTKDIPKDGYSKKQIERIVGTWKLQRIEGSNDNKKTEKTNDTHNNNAFQVLDFKPDGRYTCSTTTQAIDSGSYRLNESQGTLYLESDADDITPSEWSISIKDSRMTIAGRGGSQQINRFKYVYTKTKEGLSTNQ